MSDYIFKPPPPPPPKAAASAQPLQQQNNRNGNNRGGNRGRGRGRGGGGGGGGRRGRGRGGGAGYTVGGPPNPPRRDGAYGHGQSSNTYQQYPPPPPDEQHPQPPPSAAPNVHLNPAFFTPPAYLPTPPSAAPPPAPLPARPPQLQPTTKNLFFNPHPPTVYTTPLPNPVPSYGHFTPPTPAATSPPSKRQKPNSKPDMDQATWIALNNGNILGTNIKPPQTDAEIAEWIAARKKKFPTAEARARKEVEEQEEREKKIKRDSEMLGKRMERVKQEREERERAEEERKRLPVPEIPGEADDDDDGPPEELGAKERTVFRDDRQKVAPAKDMPVCRFFKMKGSCGRTGCRYKHELGLKNKLKKGPPAKKTLYQRLLDNDREHENKLMVEVLEYWVETGVLKDEQTAS